MSTSRKTDLIRSVQETALKYGSFTLKSGEKSHFYLDLRQTHLRAGTLTLVVDLLREELRGAAFDALGGPSLGADPLVGGFLYAEAPLRHDLRGFLVRGQEKDHGVAGRVVGDVRPGDRCVVVEDTTTTGNSVGDAVAAVRALGAEVVLAVVVVDRSQGKAADYLGQRWVPFRAILTLEDLKIRGPKEPKEGRP